MLGFPENLPCLLLPGSAVSWELVPLGEGKLPRRAGQKGTLLSKQDQKRRRESHPAAVDLARFLSPENAESACEGAAGSGSFPSPSQAVRDWAFPRSGDINNRSRVCGGTGLCSGLPLPSLGVGTIWLSSSHYPGKVTGTVFVCVSTRDCRSSY